MKPSPQATLMEFFPADTFARDRELAAYSLGFHYVAWWGNQYVPPFFVDDSVNIVCK